MKTAIQSSIKNATAAAALWLICWPSPHTLAQQPPTLEHQVAHAFAPYGPLVWVGPAPPQTAENQTLLTTLLLVKSAPWPDGLPILEEFLTNYPASPWGPSLRSQLAQAYFETGRDTLALEHWEAAWEATKDAPSGPAKAVADYTLAHWSRLLSSLGRYETLAVLLIENHDRVLDLGPLSQMWARTRENVAVMRDWPGISYKCGVFALNAVAHNIKGSVLNGG